jgi:RNA polymerase-binding transcription factor DksA
MTGQEKENPAIPEELAVRLIERYHALKQELLVRAEDPSLKKALRDVLQAMLHYVNGEAGQCESCGLLISPGRLKLSPQLRRCGSCVLE